MHNSTTAQPATDPRQAIGYAVVTPDGPIGVIDDATAEVSRAYFVTRTGWRIFSHRHLLRADLIRSVNAAERTVSLDGTAAELRAVRYRKASAPSDAGDAFTPRTAPAVPGMPATGPEVKRSPRAPR